MMVVVTNKMVLAINTQMGWEQGGSDKVRNIT